MNISRKRNIDSLSIKNESIYTIYQKNMNHTILFKKEIHENTDILNNYDIMKNIIDMLIDYQDIHMISYLFNQNINSDIRSSIYKEIIYRICNDDINNNYRTLLKHIIIDKKFDIYFNPMFIVKSLINEFEYGFLIMILENHCLDIDKDINFNELFNTKIKIDSQSDAIKYILEYVC